MVKEREFYRRFFTMCLVLVLQNVISLSVNLADNIMLGSFSEASLSGATAVNQLQFIYHQLLLGIGDGLVIFGSQYWGKKQTKEIKQISAIALLFAIVIMIVFVFTTSVFPNELLRLFSKDEAIISEGVCYLSIIKYTYIFFCFSVILLATLRTVEVVKIAFYLSLMSLAINCSINYVLIYGKFGFPQMGITGAAIGTLVSRIAEFSVIVLYITLKEKKLSLKIKDFLYINKPLLIKYAKKSAPIIISSALWGVNTALQTAIMGNMSSSAIAANSVASNLFMLVKTAAIGTASTVSVMMGKAIGEGDSNKIKSYAKTFQIMFIGLGIICSTVLFVIIDPVLSLYKLSEQSHYLAHAFLMILVVIMMFMSYQMPTNIGIIRGSGDVKYMMILDSVCIYGLVLPLSFFMAFVVKASPIIVVICLNLDQIIKCVPAFIKANYGNWVHKLTD